MYFDNSPASTDQAKISFIVSRLADKALEWATAIWANVQNQIHEQFVKDFKSVFDCPHEGKSNGELLVKIRQGNRSVAAYVLEFRTLVVGVAGTN